jgi:hypothetical protein
LIAELVMFDRGSSTLKLPALTLEAIEPGIGTYIPELVELGDGGGNDHRHDQKKTESDHVPAPVSLK